MSDTPAATPSVRASDADRERVSDQLRDHAGAGRLTPDELAERLDARRASRERHARRHERRELRRGR